MLAGEGADELFAGYDFSSQALLTTPGGGGGTNEMGANPVPFTAPEKLVRTPHCRRFAVARARLAGACISAASFKLYRREIRFSAVNHQR